MCGCARRLMSGTTAASGRLVLGRVQATAKPATADGVGKWVAVLGG